MAVRSDLKLFIVSDLLVLFASSWEAMASHIPGRTRVSVVRCNISYILTTIFPTFRHQ